MNLKDIDITQELVVIAIVIISVYMGDKDIANVSVGVLGGFLAKKYMNGTPKNP